MRIVEGSTFSIIVKCEKTPILGSDHLVNSEISSAATDLLIRRAFVVSEKNPDYILTQLYHLAAEKNKYLCNYEKWLSKTPFFDTISSTIVYLYI